MVMKLFICNNNYKNTRLTAYSNVPLQKQPCPSLLIQLLLIMLRPPKIFFLQHLKGQDRSKYLSYLGRFVMRFVFETLNHRAL